MKGLVSEDPVHHHALTKITQQKQTPSDAEVIYHITFVGWLWVWGERDVVELAKAQPLAIDRHAKVAEINGLPGRLGDFVGGGSRGFALRRQIRHDDSAYVRQNQTPPRGEKGVVAVCSRSQWRLQKYQIREDKRASKQKGQKAKMEKAHSSLQQASERVLLLFMPASSSSPPCHNWVQMRCCLKRGCLAFSSSTSSSTSCYPLCADWEFKMQREHRAEKSQPSSGQLSTTSLWLDCLCTAVNALGGCWPRWLTVVLGTATHCHVSRWCMRKKKKKKRRGDGGSPEEAMLMMQQRTHLSLKHQQSPLTWNRGLLFDSSINYWLQQHSKTPTAVSKQLANSWAALAFRFSSFST